MKLRNKKTGEIIIANITHMVSGVDFDCGQSLAELNEEWEDYEEPKDYWYITSQGNLHCIENVPDECDKNHKEFGNYFETKEEAEKAVEKLKAWKRLKDKGFRFKDWNCAMQEITFNVPESFYDRPDMIGKAISEETTKDLDLLFGGEE